MAALTEARNLADEWQNTSGREVSNTMALAGIMYALIAIAEVLQDVARQLERGKRGGEGA